MDNNMGMMEFYYRFDEQHPAVSIQLPPGTMLPEVLETFEAFLRAAGYSFRGEIMIVTVEAIPQDPGAQLN
jgi:hypothetical protein